MSVITPTITEINQPGFGRVGWIIAWANMANGDSGAPADKHAFADRSFQVEGTFGAGGTVVCEGSNDGQNYRTLSDHFGSSASMTAAGVIGVNQVPLWMRPRVTAGDGTTSLTVTLFIRRTNDR